MLRRLAHRFALPLVLAAALAACETVPITGRSQLNFIDDEQAAQLGEQAFQQIKAKERISRDPAANAVVQRVGQRIAAASGIKQNWEFVVFDSPQVNAFALPGGKVGVYTGMLPVAGDEAGLAAVMGHEVGHVLANHAAERISRSQLVEAGAGAAALILGGSNPAAQQSLAALLGAGAAVGLELPFSRDQEYEADRIGLTLMAKAGYDPRAAIPFWQRMAAASRGGPPEFLSTHPGEENRIARIRELLPEAQAVYRPR
jgi:metalloendopeptidase OMA1, mitochondrial